MIYASILFVLIGILAGFLGGLLGIGGGLVSVPALVWMFQWMHFTPSHLLQTAIGTSLSAMVFTAASSAWAHIRQKGVIWHLFFQLTPGIIVGSMFGALIADYLPSAQLKLVFGVCECLIGFYFLFLQPTTSSLDILKHPTVFFPASIGIGILSTILGIGGGIITVPFLTAQGTPMKNAISTSAATGFIIAIVGAITFLYLGSQHSTQPTGIGYVYLPAFLLIGLTSIISAPLGAKLTYSLSTSMLRKIFGLILIGVGFWMISRP